MLSSDQQPEMKSAQVTIFHSSPAEQSGAMAECWPGGARGDAMTCSTQYFVDIAPVQYIIVTFAELCDPGVAVLRTGGAPLVVGSLSVRTKIASVLIIPHTDGIQDFPEMKTQLREISPDTTIMMYNTLLVEYYPILHNIWL